MNKKNSYKIIVARYNEDISWLKDEMQNSIIINKGDERLNLKNEICVDNVGRESETYLKYIINNYNQLPDTIVFTQGRLEDHKHLWEKFDCEIDFLKNLREEAMILGKSYNFFEANRDCPHFGSNWNWRNDDFFLKENYKKQILFKDWFEKKITCQKGTYPDKLRVYGAGLFAVSKKLVLKRPREYYQNLIKELKHSSNPAEGHFFERSWYYIFE
jgi:hypothetical protein